MQLNTLFFFFTLSNTEAATKTNALFTAPNANC